MKGFYSICMLVLSTLFTVNVAAEEAEEQAATIVQGAEMYMEEITNTCNAEAEGMEDASTYVNECINNMKQQFTESN